MLVHLRLICPEGLTEQVASMLDDDDRVTNLVVQPGVARRPAGDLVQADVAREAADDVLQAIDDLGVDERGGIALGHWASTPSAGAERADRNARGDPEDAVIWEDVADQTQAATRATVSFFVFLTVAVSLAAIALITDSAILVVGAMVVGPEFTTVAAIAFGLITGRWPLAGRGLRLLVVGFLAAITGTAALALIGRAAGLVPVDAVTRPAPQTEFVWQPTVWSFIVAVLAGTAGVLALTTEKSQAMVGVFISVTTVPAAGNLALCLALWVPREIGGSLLQLGVNIAGMIVAGTVVLVLQRWAWDRLNRRRRPVSRALHPRTP